jgi:hypothetical protein
MNPVVSQPLNFEIPLTIWLPPTARIAPHPEKQDLQTTMKGCKGLIQTNLILQVAHLAQGDLYMFINSLSPVVR